jgi:hypothetical protein
MRAKLTNEIVDQKLLRQKSSIKRIGDIISSQIKSDFQCLVEDCQFIWSSIPNNILRGRGCPNCSGHIKLTNEIVDRRLKEQNRTIKRLGDVVNSSTKTNFECLIEICRYKWFAIINHVLNKHSGCPKCAGNIKLTNADIDQRLIDQNRTIKRIGHINGMMNKIDFQCIINDCLYVWKAKPSDILNSKQGCPKCAKRVKLTNKEVDCRLITNNSLIKRIGDIIGANIKTDFQCLICQYNWKTRPSHVITGKSGCPKCANLAKLTNEIVDQRLIGRNIKRLSDIITALLKVDFQCEICEYKWTTSPSSILNTKSGCLKCSSGKNEKTVGLILEKYFPNIESQKRIRDFDPNETKRYSMDYYLPQIAIEYNGRQHYEPVCFGGCLPEQAQLNFIERQARDAYVQTFCDNNSINLISIDGRKYQGKKLEKYLINELVPQLKQLHQSFIIDKSKVMVII